MTTSIFSFSKFSQDVQEKTIEMELELNQVLKYALIKAFELADDVGEDVGIFLLQVLKEQEINLSQKEETESNQFDIDSIPF